MAGGRFVNDGDVEFGDNKEANIGEMNISQWIIRLKDNTELRTDMPL